MPVPKKYFHDRLVVLLLAINAFLVVVGAILVLFRIDSSRSAGYIIEYRANFGVGEFRTGKSLDLASFVFFQVVNIAIAVMLSMRIYNLRRHAAILLLSLAVLLSVLSIVVSNALIGLR
jgi:hypothetical protein